MKAAINASPLIFLAKLEKLTLLKLLLTEYYVTDIVLEEVVKKALQCGYIEAEPIQKFAVEHVVEADKGKAEKLAEKFNIHIGEASTILLAKRMNLNYVIVDDKVAIKVVKIMGLKPLSTPFILLKALKDRQLTHKEFIRCFEKLIQHGYYISPSFSRKILEKADKLKNELKN